ncbi:MAG: hypothetical protein E7123_08130 [Bacteroidales bacterium]|nr:hypothetical protein [Bacteroidales bacterium]
MKRILTYTLTFILLLSCTKEVQESVSLSLYISGKDLTKVGLDASLRTYWSQGDEATVFYRSPSASKWYYDGTDGAYSGILKYSGTPMKESEAAIYAVCPANGTATLSGTVISLDLPTEQILGGSRNMVPMLVAGTSGSDLVFDYATALVGFSLEGYGQVKDIVLKGNEGEALCGAATIDMSQSAPHVVLDSEATGTEIRLKAEGDACLADVAGESCDFYISLPPMTLKDGFTIQVNYMRGASQLIKYTGSVKLNAGELLMVGTIRTDDEFILEVDFNQGYGYGKSNVSGALSDFKTDYGVTLPTSSGTSSAVYDMNISGQTYRFELGYCNGVSPVGYFYLTASDTLEPSLAISTNGWYMKLPKVENHVLTGFSNVAGRTITSASSTEYFITTDVSVSRADARNKCVSGKLMAPQEIGQEYRAYITEPSEDKEYYLNLYAGGWLYIQNLKLYYRRIR